ncbi:hypothetical protein D2Q93_13260 [Alicyclobacillaceae bacterium I2511]|nr:hypothetical protein D2Q93_13260 [Alicyclobacillaceae bacterium I2511]
MINRNAAIERGFGKRLQLACMEGKVLVDPLLQIWFRMVSLQLIGISYFFDYSSDIRKVEVQADGTQSQ